MDFQELKTELNIAITNLFLIAKDYTFNNYSSNLKFIISEIRNNELNSFEQAKIGVIENEKKIPIQYDDAVKELINYYDEIYDINLYIYKSTLKETIIDIKYFLKTSLDLEYRKIIINEKAMIHSKINLPMNYRENEKFDINWKFENHSNCR
ncbi:hypothetical protein [Chryseobacterium oryctis]|uniref:Uncharacterized protein n=1 Tax=Chryseobacterium oryctis TaxID=2952618 RepID=A0ABT3HQZ0_9FLAO|nr:hypothetical protein [Chryseobacterium oryctis]MCW3162177.1 hypothetical protein [Chryseobacterium oryctis]